MAGDLYSLLGVRRAATPDQVKAAYRRRALALHPDRGGDRAAFDRAQLAYEVLSDPARRARYDATGETGRPADPARRAALELVAAAVIAAVEGVVSGRGKAEHAHLAEHVRHWLRGKKAEAEKALKGLEAAGAALAEAAGRFTAPDGGENLLAAVARSHLALAEREKAKAAAVRDAAAAALELVKNQGYRLDPRPAPSWGSAATAGGAWGFTTA